MFNPYDVVYTVLITEKATALSEKFHRYTIKVNPHSNKIEIRKAVEAIFEGVKRMSSQGTRSVIRPARRFWSG